MPYKIPSPELDATDRLFLGRGMIPGWRRVWSNGEDVTDRPISEWPPLVQQSYAAGWRPVVNVRGNFMR